MGDIFLLSDTSHNKKLNFALGLGLFPGYQRPDEKDLGSHKTKPKRRYRERVCCVFASLHLGGIILDASKQTRTAFLFVSSIDGIRKKRRSKVSISSAIDNL